MSWAYFSLQQINPRNSYISEVCYLPRNRLCRKSYRVRVQSHLPQLMRCQFLVGGWSPCFGTDNTTESVHNWFVWQLHFCSSHNYHPQRSWGKVIFSEACVKNSVHGGIGHMVPPGQVHPPFRAGTPPGQVHTPKQVHPHAGTPPWSMSGRYASYWNAFLFVQCE